jgi:hypothetical protein
MSRENVEIMRRATEAINRRDKEAWLALADPGLSSARPPTGQSPR